MYRLCRLVRIWYIRRCLEQKKKKSWKITKTWTCKVSHEDPPTACFARVASPTFAKKSLGFPPHRSDVQAEERKKNAKKIQKVELKRGYPDLLGAKDAHNQLRSRERLWPSFRRGVSPGTSRCATSRQDSDVCLICAWLLEEQPSGHVSNRGDEKSALAVGLPDFFFVFHVFFLWAGSMKIVSLSFIVSRTRPPTCSLAIETPADSFLLDETFSWATICLPVLWPEWLKAVRQRCTWQWLRAETVICHTSLTLCDLWKKLTRFWILLVFLSDKLERKASNPSRVGSGSQLQKKELIYWR